MDKVDIGMKKIPEVSLLKLIFAGSLGSIFGTLLLESIRGEKPVVGWVALAVLIGFYSAMTKTPIIRGDLQGII